MLIVAYIKESSVMKRCILFLSTLQEQKNVHIKHCGKFGMQIYSIAFNVPYSNRQISQCVYGDRMPEPIISDEYSSAKVIMGKETGC